jgi:hypothetical protein
MTVLLDEQEDVVVVYVLTTVVVFPDPLGDAVTDAGELVEIDVGGEVAVSEMRIPVRLYEAAQAARDNPWCC